MFRRAFTLIEIMVAVIILGILVTVGIPSYQNFVEDSRSRVCQSNLLSLKTALDVYITEKGVVPADLSQVPADYIQRAFAACSAEGGWRLKLAVAVTAMDELGKAYADVITELAAGKVEILRCPKDTSSTGRSYGLFSPLIDMSAEQYRLLKGKPVPFIADISGTTSAGTFSNTSGLALRHRTVRLAGSGDQYGNVIFNNGVIAAVKSGGDVIKVTFRGHTMVSLTKRSPDIDSDSYTKMSSVLNSSLSKIISDVITITGSQYSAGSSDNSLDPLPGMVGTSYETNPYGQTESYTTVYTPEQVSKLAAQTVIMVDNIGNLRTLAAGNPSVAAVISTYLQTAEDAKAKSAEAAKTNDYAALAESFQIVWDAYQRAEQAARDAGLLN